MKRLYKLNVFVFLILITTVSQAQKGLLQSGPMVGYSEMREVQLWVQTTKPAKVKIVYWDKETKNKKISTDEVITNKKDAYTAHLFADEVEPGRKYSYELYIDNKNVKLPYPLEFQTLKLWQWRGDAPDFSFAIGSCAYIDEEQYDRPGKPYGGNYEIFKNIFEKHPDFMLWLGDNTYLREVDWNTRTGIIKRNTHTRSLPELQPLLGSIHNYAIWDDHDYSSDNSDRSYFFKETSLDIFKLFWANPSYGVNGKPGITTQFQWSDVDFFLLDDRYNRTPDGRKTGERVMFGDDQVQWLIDALVSSKATFKIIVSGGELLNPEGNEETFSKFPVERDKLLDLIKQENIKGVIFFSGDIHSAEITKMERAGTYPLYDFTISPLTAGVYIPKKELNPWFVPGYRTYERNFAYFTVTGTKKNRIISCTDYNFAGKEMWKFSLNENELK